MDPPRGVHVARVAAEHVVALTEFYRQVWDPAATPETVRASRAQAAAANPVTPGEPPPTWLVLKDGRALAHVTTIPVVLWLQGSERAAHWIKGLWVLPEHQRSAAGFLVLRAAVESLPVALALAHEPAAVRLFGALGFTDLGSLPNALRILRGGQVFRRLAIDRLGLGGIPGWMRLGLRILRHGAPVLGPASDVATRLWAASATGPLWGVTATADQELDRENLDALWAEVRGEVHAAAARNGAYLAERYPATAGYVFVHARRKRRLDGVAIVKAPRVEGDPRLQGIRVATLSDLLYRPSRPRTGLALLRAAERAAAELGADALLSGTSAAALRPLLRRRGHVGLPGNLRVLARFAGETPPSPLTEWWVTRGDSGGDGTF